MSSRRLQDMSSRRLQHMSSRRLEDVFSKTIFRLPKRLGRRKIFTLKTCWRRLQDQQIFAGKAFKWLMVLKNLSKFIRTEPATLPKNRIHRRYFGMKLSKFLREAFLQKTISPANISTTDHRCFNVVDQRWNNVDLTLRMKQNPTSDFQRCTTLIQRRCATLKQRWNNVDTTLSQLCCSLASTLVKAVSKQVGLVISTNS